MIWVPLFIAIVLVSVLLLLASTSTGLACLTELQGYDRNSTNYLNMRKINSSISIPLSEENTRSNKLDKIHAVSIKFENLYLTTGSTKRLNGINGFINSGKFTAIIGGSGAGKTSLMNVILGREIQTSGNIEFISDKTGVSLPSKFVKNHVAFVPQSDILIRDLTVNQLLYHSARTRLPKGTTSSYTDELVNTVLSRLGIKALRHLKVGGGGSKGLSAGDRKKVNMAVELVTGPHVLFLDEPTTGIDASAAMNVAEIVKELAMTGLTCVAVIHQPRGEIFKLLDDLIVLAPGGLMAYNGPAYRVLEWFATQGFNLPHPKANKIDFILDVTTGNFEVEEKLSSETNTAPVASSLSSSSIDWAALWSAEGQNFLNSNATQISKIVEVNLQEGDKIGPIEEDDIFLSRFGLLTQFFLFAYQGFLQRIKRAVLVQDLFNVFIGGVVLGIVTCGGPLIEMPIPVTYKRSCPPGVEAICERWQSFEIGPATFLVTMVFGALTIPAAVRTFGREKKTFEREEAVGANKLAYFFGKTFIDFIFSSFNVFIFISPILAIAPWRSPVDKFYALILCLSMFVNALGYVLSIIISDADNAVLTGTIICILLNLFGGFVPKLGDGAIGKIFYTHWVARALAATELRYGYLIKDDSIYNSIVGSNWENYDYPSDLGNILIIALVTLMFAYFVFEFQFSSFMKK